MHPVSRYLFIALFATVVSTSLAQGPLEPPGAPAPTMITLQQIEPRTPITNLPYIISNPGSYYLAGNLSSTGHGVWVQANNVTLDLMGFRIEGSGLQSYHGVYILNTNNQRLQNVVVQNGIITQFDHGILASQIQGAWIENIHVWTNMGNGIFFPSGSFSGGNMITRCVAGDNGQHGIYIVNEGSGNVGNTISHCSIVGNQYGVTVAIGQGNVITHNTISRNRSHGLWLFQAASTRVENNHVTSQTAPVSYGIISQNPFASNFIFSNTSAGNTTNYVLGALDVYGPIVTNTGALAVTGAASHVRANFSR